MTTMRESTYIFSSSSCGISFLNLPISSFCLCSITNIAARPMLNPTPPAKGMKTRYDEISGLFRVYMEAGIAMNIGPPVIRGGRRKGKKAPENFRTLVFFETICMINLTAMRATMVPTTLPTSIRSLIRTSVRNSWSGIGAL